MSSHPLSSYSHHSDVLHLAATDQAPIALCLLTHVEGGTLRAKGAMMTVSEDAVWGYVSAGCVDGDIVFQARQALADGKVRQLRYGAGSPFKDITLPCGGTIDILILPRVDPIIIQEASRRLEARQSVQLSISLTPHGEAAVDITGDTNGVFTHEYPPKIKLRIAGRGEAAEQLLLQACLIGFDVHLQSPDTELLARHLAIPQTHLLNPQTVPAGLDDPYTAVVFLFHDHDWEEQLLRQALNGPAFYIGAMGSARTHNVRCEGLQAMGVDGADIARIHGPIGLIPAMRDANLLAVSILAEVVQVAQTKGLSL
ncbi:XdhC family protein [Litorimonas sp. RW-G-Af-16]|uniref:XdhC family protein n=1 Tax=Litorimonas sp. RW-G-Af-16 TaxID=3241168 RepID=UPI00390CC497